MSCLPEMNIEINMRPCSFVGYCRLLEDTFVFFGQTVLASVFLTVCYKQSIYVLPLAIYVACFISSIAVLCDIIGRLRFCFSTVKATEQEKKDLKIKEN
jgi:hypothetical protein